MSFFSKLSDGLYNFGWRTFVLPPLLTLAGVAGFVMVASSPNKATTSGEGGIVFGLGIIAMIVAVLGMIVISIPLSLLTGLSFLISVPLSYWLAMAIACNVFAR